MKQAKTILILLGEIMIAFADDFIEWLKERRE